MSAARQAAQHGAAQPGGQRGLTLIEVLVALAVVAITLTAGIKAAGSMTASAQRLEEVTVAQWCADNQLVGLRLARAFPGVGESTFVCQQLGRRFKGVMTVRPTPNPNFRRVDAKVLDAGGHTIYSLTTILPRY